MAGMSTTFEANALKWLLRNTQMPTPPATVYISLHTADPGQTGASEVSGGSYARVSCTTGTSGTGVGSIYGAPATSGTTQQSQNASAITFPSPTGDWGDIGWYGVWDAASSGNYLIGGALTSHIHPLNGNAAPSFAINGSTINFD